MALAGSTALIGAPWRTVGGNDDQGAAYVFRRSGSSWSQQAQLSAANGAVGDFFGNSVALSGSTALIGAPWHNADQGAAYVFTRASTGWIQQAQLSAANGAAGDFFGVSVALAGAAALVGAPDKTVGGNTDQGAAYVFTRSGITWSQQAQLTAANGAAGDNFGFSVAISGDTALVGAPNKTVGRNADQGVAYAFRRSGSSWSQQAQLRAARGSAGDYFGNSVSLSGSTALVGAPYHTVRGHTDQGAAYVFVRSGSTWSQRTQLQ